MLLMATRVLLEQVQVNILFGRMWLHGALGEKSSTHLREEILRPAAVAGGDGKDHIMLVRNLLIH